MIHILNGLAALIFAPLLYPLHLAMCFYDWERPYMPWDYLLCCILELGCAFIEEE